MNSHSRTGPVPAQSVAANDLSLNEENKRLKARIAELERMVLRDTLTPLYNRRHFMDVLDRWILRAHRYGGNYALFFIDVDHLKSVNDAHGHEAGDQLLITSATTLQSIVRRSDIVARMGGDEFGMMLENIKAQDLETKAASITKSAAKQWIDYRGTTLKPSISVGYTMIEGGISSAELLQRADQSMYQTKQAKRA